jgi:hypothetical protein
MVCCILILVVGVILIYISPCRWEDFLEPEDHDRGIVPPDHKDIEEANSVPEDSESNHGVILDVEDHS